MEERNLETPEASHNQKIKNNFHRKKEVIKLKKLVSLVAMVVVAMSLMACGSSEKKTEQSASSKIEPSASSVVASSKVEESSSVVEKTSEVATEKKTENATEPSSNVEMERTGETNTEYFYFGDVNAPGIEVTGYSEAKGVITKPTITTSFEDGRKYSLDLDDEFFNKIKGEEINVVFYSFSNGAYRYQITYTKIIEKPVA